MAATNYLETALLNTLKGRSFVRDEIYLALFTTYASETKSGTEPSDAAYERPKIEFCTPTVTSDGKETYIANTNKILSKSADENWGKIVSYGLFDAKTGGNLLIYGIMDNPQNVLSGQKFMIDERRLRVTLS